MSSHASPQPAPRLRGGSWRYAVPTAAGAGAAKFRENLRRLGGGDLLRGEPGGRAAGSGRAERSRDDR